MDVQKGLFWLRVILVTVMITDGSQAGDTPAICPADPGERPMQCGAPILDEQQFMALDSARVNNLRNIMMDLGGGPLVVNDPRVQDPNLLLPLVNFTADQMAAVDRMYGDSSTGDPAGGQSPLAGLTNRKKRQTGVESCRGGTEELIIFGLDFNTSPAGVWELPQIPVFTALDDCTLEPGQSGCRGDNGDCEREAITVQLYGLDASSGSWGLGDVTIHRCTCANVVDQG